MELLKKGFEATLKAKLSQKSAGLQSDETFLARNFKYFDTDNDGSVSMDEWIKTIERAGVIILSKEDLKALFRMYDVNGNGKLEYKEFIKILYSKAKTQ